MEVKIASSSGSKSQVLLYGVLALVLIGGGVYWYMNKQSLDVIVVEAPTGEGAALANNQKAQEILSAIKLLESVNLDTEFFNDERFAALRLTPVIIPLVQPTRQSFLKFVVSDKK